MKTYLNMDKLGKVPRVKNELCSTTLNDQLNIPSAVQAENVKQENNSSIYSEVVLKTEPREANSELSIGASTSYNICSTENIKYETMIKIEYGDVENNKVQSSLDVGNQSKDAVENEDSISSMSKESIENKMLEPDEKEEHLLTTKEKLGLSKRGSNNKNLILRRRERTRVNTEFTCNICYKIFPWQCYLNRHLQTHSDDKPFKCHICEKDFKLEFCLESHMLSHSVEKPHACDICQRVFTHKSTLIKHKLTHTDLKLYACGECDKSFKHKYDLVKHKLIHTGHKPYTCDFCDKAFTQKITLTQHRRLHTGEKPFSCDVCNKSFSRKSALNLHEKIHKDN